MSVPALVRIEHGISSPKPSTLAAIRKALEEADVEFTNGGEPGVKLRKAQPTSWLAETSEAEEQ